MTITLDEYKRIKSRVDQLRAKADRAEGAYEAAMKRLHELGFDSIEDAEDGLEKLKEEELRAQKAYESELTKFKKKWGDLLNGD